jgi:hypothetical protein
VAIVFVVATQVLDLPPGYVGVAIALVFLFLMINGISPGHLGQQPDQLSAFVVAVFIMATVGLDGPRRSA